MVAILDHTVLFYDFELKIKQNVDFKNSILYRIVHNTCMHLYVNEENV